MSDELESFWNINELRQIHVELTNGCNAACPLCVRFYNNSPNIRPDLEIGQITLTKFKNYFPPKILQNCHLMMFCGVHGDPGVARDLLEICQYISDSSSNINLTINTNGGMRKPEWWAELGKIFNNHPRWQLTFSIDGLEDTNHLYRRNVKWNSLIQNVKAFIDSGGYAKWDYLIFKHNEHQLDQAKQLSVELGFKEFIPKKALGVDNGEYLTHMPVRDKNGDLDYVIEAPVNPEHRNLENPKGTAIIQHHSFDIENYQHLKKTKQISNDFKIQLTKVKNKIDNEDNSKYNNLDIKCKSKMPSGGKEIFVDNFGRVIPCCYIGTMLNSTYTDTNTLQLHKQISDYGWENFDLNKFSLEDIISNKHLDNVFADSWTKPTMAKGKLGYCAETCGTVSSIDRIFTHKEI